MLTDLCAAFFGGVYAVAGHHVAPFRGTLSEPPIYASLQYLGDSGNEVGIWNAGLPLGFTSPFHQFPR